MEHVLLKENSSVLANYHTHIIISSCKVVDTESTHYTVHPYHRQSGSWFVTFNNLVASFPGSLFGESLGMPFVQQATKAVWRPGNEANNLALQLTTATASDITI